MGMTVGFILDKEDVGQVFVGLHRFSLVFRRFVNPFTPPLPPDIEGRS